jgi:hypothetical protein
VIALAPSGGGDLHAAMAERPRILRSLRALDATALLACALALAVAPAQAAVSTYAQGYSDPSADRALIALHRPGTDAGVLRDATSITPLPGTHPALGEGRAAWIVNGTVVVPGTGTLAAPDADALAVSSAWVAWRAGESLVAAPLDPAAGFVPRTVAAGEVGRPALTGGLLVFDRSGRIESIELNSGTRTILRREARAHLTGPSVLQGRLSYVRSTYRRQQVRVGALIPRPTTRDDALFGLAPAAHRDAGHEPGRSPARGHINKPLWTRAPAGVTYTLTTTALAADAVYVTRLRQRRNLPASSTILRIDR